MTPDTPRQFWRNDKQIPRRAIAADLELTPDLAQRIDHLEAALSSAAKAFAGSGSNTAELAGAFRDLCAQVAGLIKEITDAGPPSITVSPPAVNVTVEPPKIEIPKAEAPSVQVTIPPPTPIAYTMIHSYDPAGNLIKTRITPEIA